MIAAGQATDVGLWNRVRIQRISGTSSFFFELSGAANSTIGSDQIDYVNFRPNRATEWDSTPIKMQPGIEFGHTSPG